MTTSAKTRRVRRAKRELWQEQAGDELGEGSGRQGPQCVAAGWAVALRGRGEEGRKRRS